MAALGRMNGAALALQLHPRGERRQVAVFAGRWSDCGAQTAGSVAGPFFAELDRRAGRPILAAAPCCAILWDTVLGGAAEAVE